MMRKVDENGGELTRYPMLSNLYADRTKPPSVKNQHICLLEIFIFTVNATEPEFIYLLLL
ncbi:hypothetical protein C7H79_15760 [Nitrosomonas supralitoralis]|uniref:Uncharacterized protein n=1 Tax=Nitrosomonas supralitoralis TaxID=2116706 RepID=A0A2P7NRB3_9PROT|nr:hypothetical protein C7H79_15760 [Nitrosomonas supralitoralis]